MKNPDKTPIIETCGLVKDFVVRGKMIPVLRGINLSVPAGKIAVIRGRSGAGKSVLLWLLSGLDRPTKGDILFEGFPLAALSHSKIVELRQNKIALIFQNFNLVTSWTASENVASAIENQGMTASKAIAQSKAILTELGLENRLDNLPAELSFGQQQRVAVARSLAIKPHLILADEPTGGVDPETAAQILSLLMQPVKDYGATLIVATHGHFPEEIADMVYSLDEGVLDPVS